MLRALVCNTLQQFPLSCKQLRQTIRPTLIRSKFLQLALNSIYFHLPFRPPYVQKPAAPVTRAARSDDTREVFNAAIWCGAGIKVHASVKPCLNVRFASDMFTHVFRQALKLRVCNRKKLRPTLRLFCLLAASALLYVNVARLSCLTRPLFAGDPEVRILGYGKEQMWKQIFT